MGIKMGVNNIKTFEGLDNTEGVVLAIYISLLVKSTTYAVLLWCSRRREES